MTARRDRVGLSAAEGRIPDGGLRALGLINWVVNWIAAQVIRAPRMHLFTTLGQHRRLFRAWFVFGAVLYAGKLPRPDTELVILRVAHLRDCEYELQQHRRFGARRGVPPEVQDQIFRLAPLRQALAAPCRRCWPPPTSSSCNARSPGTPGMRCLATCNRDS